MSKKSTRKTPNKTEPKKMKNGFKYHLRQSANLLMRNKKAIALIWLLQTVIVYIFSQGVTPVDISELKNTFENDYGLDTGSIGGRLLLSTVVIQGVSTLESSGAAYMLFFTLAMILALVWVLRHSWQNKTTTIAAAYYQGLYPIAQYFLLTLVAAIQLLPITAGSYLMSIAMQRSIFVSLPEYIGGIIILLLLPAIWSYAMIVRTLMASFIVTIPEIKPLEAFKSAKEMLKNRSFFVMKLLLIWILLISLFFVALMLLVIAISPILAIILSTLFNGIFVILVITFSYSIYRSLL